MTSPQPAILPESGPFALYALMKVKGNSAVVNARCKEIHDLAEEINANQSDARLCASIAFAPEYWNQTGIAAPENFEPFKPLGQGNFRAPATDYDILVHCHSNRHDLNFYLLREFLSTIADEIEIIDETYGFRYLDSRDMIGFVDGTENPKARELREQVAIIADGECRGGSLVMLQRFVHQLRNWETLPVGQQEQVIGRTKQDSVELAEVPSDSHVGRVDIKEGGKGLKIVRHSLPYGSLMGDHGLLFIAYCNSQHPFKAMLRSMYGETDGPSDQLLNFTQAVTGAFGYAPSLEQLGRL